jgi:hypothetical protein
LDRFDVGVMQGVLAATVEVRTAVAKIGPNHASANLEQFMFDICRG